MEILRRQTLRALGFFADHDLRMRMAIFHKELVPSVKPCER